MTTELEQAMKDIRAWYVKVIDLAYCDIGEAGAKQLADALKINKSITTIYLSINNIGDDGAKSLADALKINKSITTIYLYGNNIGDEGAQSLADSLNTNTSITLMYLFGNDNIEESTLEQIGSLLARNKTIIERRRTLTALLSCLSE